jgi:hypothetical protein
MGTVREKLHSFVEQLRTEASEWHAWPGFGPLLFVVPLLGSVGIVLARADNGLYRFLTDEDSVLEWSQFVGFVAACVFALLCAWGLHGAGRSVLALAYLAFAIGCFFVAGEEIAWGERVLGYGTPEALEEINEQKETTVHNIDVVQQFTNLTYFLAGLYGSIVAWIVRGRSMWRRSDLVDLLLPPIFLTTAFFVMFAYKGLRFAFFRESGFTVTRAGEWAELCLALGFSVFAFLQWRRLRGEE